MAPPLPSLQHSLFNGRLLVLHARRSVVIVDGAGRVCAVGGGRRGGRSAPAAAAQVAQDVHQESGVGLGRGGRRLDTPAGRAQQGRRVRAAQTLRGENDGRVMVSSQAVSGGGGVLVVRNGQAETVVPNRTVREASK